MNFLVTDLGYREVGDIVDVTLSGSAANVRLLDSGNLDRFRRGQQHRYLNGFRRFSYTPEMTNAGAVLR